LAALSAPAQAGPGAGEPLLVARHVGKTFVGQERSTRVLEDINIEIPERSFVSLIGASGCGKTTLLRIMHGLIAPSQGEIRIRDNVVKGTATGRGFVLQQDSLLPWRTVIANVTFGLEIMAVPKREARERARKLLKIVGLEGNESSYPAEISGGMRQRVNLARALAVDPEILFMDEPFAALDAQTREHMQAELLRIWNIDRKTVVFVTHQLDEAVYLSDTVIVLASRPGRVKEVIQIDLPRPRDLSVKSTAQFGAYVQHIRNLIDEDTRYASGSST
jgi:NitT/TauT family transport system ATP-binding protein